MSAPRGAPRPVMRPSATAIVADAGRADAGRANGGLTGDHLDECTRCRSAPGQGDFDLDGFLRSLLATGTTAPASVEVRSDQNDQLPPGTVAEALATATRPAPRAAGASG